MTFRTMLVLAFTMALAPVAWGAEPAWLKDYDSARKQGKEEKKPLAVIVASGQSGWEQLSKEGKLTLEVKEFLADNYVCVYVDTEHIAGKRLASEFELEGGLGIVISDSSVSLQAFRHEGDLTNDKLLAYLHKYSDPDRLVATTDSNPGSEVSVAASVTPQVSVADPFASPATVYGAPAPVTYTSFSGFSRAGCST